jgi:hypothetical protein
MCALYGTTYGHKLSRTYRTHNFGAKAAAAGARRDQAQARASGAKAPDGPRWVLAARADAGGAPARPVGPEPWSAMLLIALGVGGILAPLPTRAADL